MAADLDSLDGRNALVTFTATVAGVYTVEVKSTAGVGEYLLDISFNVVISADNPNGDGTNTGNGDGDVIRLVRNGALIEEYIDGVFSQSFPYGPLAQLVVEGSALDNDTLILDESQGPVIPPGGVVFNGYDAAGDNDVLEYIGSGGQVVTYRPSATTAGDGELEIDGRVVTFTGLEPTAISNVAAYTLLTLNDADVVTVDNPAPGVLLLTGTSDGVAFESATLTDVVDVVIDGLTNDAGGSDVITFNPALNGLASGQQQLTNLTVLTGTGDDQLTVSLPFTLPGFGTFLWDAGGGTADFDQLTVNASAGPIQQFTWIRDGAVIGMSGDQTITFAGLGSQDQLFFHTDDGDDVTYVELLGYQTLPQVILDGQGGTDSLYLFGRWGLDDTFLATPTGAAAGADRGDNRRGRQRVLHERGGDRVDRRE